MATLNRWIAYGLLAFALVLAFIGAFFGFFGGINDGLLVGLKLLLVPGLIAAALVGGSYSFHMAARAHASLSPQRWGIQLLAIAITSISVMIAMYAMSLLDRFLPT
jgi:hypothetical protein